jgi:amino acid adenylation domain-containing protein
MVPSYFAVIEAIPLTANGKVDRKALPDPLTNRFIKKEEYVAPSNEIEEKLAEIWQEVLHVEKIGVYDDFFGLGGNSILAITLLNKISKSTGFTLALASLFESPTILELSKKMGNQEKDKGLTLPGLLVDPQKSHAPFPLTDIQQAYWVGRSGLYELGGVGTHSYAELYLRELDVERLNKAINMMIDRHDMLRMVITEDGQQRILEKTEPYKVQLLDMRACTPEEEEQKFLSLRNELSHQFFSGHTWPLFDIRVSIFRDGTYKLHYSIDMLLFDASSSIIFFKELVAFYLDNDRKLPGLSLSFRDYVLTEQSLKGTELYNRSRQYWTDRIHSLPKAPELSLAKTPGEIGHVKFSRQSLQVSSTKWNKLKDKTIAAGVTPTVFILQCFGEVMRRWSKTDHFTLNLTLFNRLPFHEDVNNILGDFTSLTLLEMNYREAKVFKDRLKDTQYQLWSDLEHRYFSGVEVQRELSRATGETITMPVVVTSTLGLENNENKQTNTRETDKETRVELKEAYSISQTPQVWIDCQIKEQEGCLQVDWDSVKELFPGSLLEDMFAAFEGLLTKLAEEDSLWEAQTIDLIPTSQQRLHALANETINAYPDKLLHGLFTEQVKQRGEKRALVTREKTLTYGELYQISTHMGEQLRNLGAKPNELVAIVMDKGWEQVAAALGIQFSGAAYLPIDASLPHERILRLLEIGEVKIVVTLSTIIKGVKLPATLKTLLVDQIKTQGKAESSTISYQKSSDLAYVIFTSGSTGDPKGVMIDHRGAVNTILDINQRVGITEKDCCFALSSLNFDLSVYDVFGMLAAGGTLVIPAPEEQKDPSAWVRYLQREKVTVWNSVPALMQMLVEHAGEDNQTLALKQVLLSGDWIPVSLPDKIKELSPGVNVISLGGATEASIWSIYYPIDKVDSTWKSIPYGKPLSNQRFYVLKADMTPCPEWVPGDLYIGGIGLAQGYWKDDKKTSSSFVIHPTTGQRLYKTGDLGRYLPDGNIEFLGREDFQVKIQGHRIELGEIETALKGHKHIEAAVVDAKTVGNAKKLVAYIVPKQEAVDKDKVGGLALSGNTITDKTERTLFKLGQKGIRNIDTELVELTKGDFGEITLRDVCRSYKFNDEKISFEKFSGIFTCLRQKDLEGVPLPKYLYPSAGSLYPVQTYVYVGEGKVEGVEGGYYYYSPKVNGLYKTSDKHVGKIKTKSIEKGSEQGVLVFLISDQGAIEPMYGTYAEDFSHLEAGYMGQLLHASLPQGLGLQYVEPEKGYGNYFKLGQNHRLQQVFSIGCGYPIEEERSVHQGEIVESIPAREGELRISLMHIADTKSLTLSFEERKSYRSFTGSAIPQAALSALLSVLKNLQTQPSIKSEGLRIYVHLKEGRVEQLQGGVYLLEVRSMQLIRQNIVDDLKVLFAGSEAIYNEAAFSIIIASKKTKESQRKDIQYSVGYIGQLLMNVSTKHNIGLCAIGIVDQKALHEKMDIQPDYEVLHSFLGGNVSRQQIESMDAPTQKALTAEEEIREYLGSILPEYMVPSYFAVIEAIPLTANGKVDRKALPDPLTNRFIKKEEYVAPSNEIEEKLVRIFQEVLGIEEVGMNDNFFELGLNSMQIIGVSNTIKKELNKKIEIVDLFMLPTIRKLSNNLAGNDIKENDNRNDKIDAGKKNYNKLLNKKIKTDSHEQI